MISVPLLVDDEIAARVAKIDVPFNAYGLDPYGVSRDHLAQFFSVLGWFYDNYFNVQVVGAENIPSEGSAFIIGNHSGGIPVDGGMVLTSLIKELDPPRLGHAMVEKFASALPFLSQYYSRFGQFTGLPEHATRFLREGRLVVAFPEGVRGIGKLYSDRYQLSRFGTGFMRIALEAGAPIVPFAFVGGEEVFPVMMRLEKLGKALGAPFIPVPKHIIPFPVPLTCRILYGEPMYFEGDGSEGDDVIIGYVDQVKERICALIEQGRDERRDTVSSFVETDRDDSID